jgi:hypothetical protein
VGRILRWCGVALAFAVVLFFLWPYRSEKIVSHVEGGCDVTVGQYSGWKQTQVAPGVHASDVAYPLSLIVFVKCDGERPASVRLEPAPGRPGADGQDCVAGSPAEGRCWVEAPPIASPKASHDLVLSVVRRPGAAPETVRVEVRRIRTWRSVVWDALMSV